MVSNQGQGECPAIGIDLGTTNSCVAVWQNERVEIIVNDQGKRTTASYVAFTPMEHLIGDAAKNQVPRNPTNSIFGTLEAFFSLTNIYIILLLLALHCFLIVFFHLLFEVLCFLYNRVL